jgi:hypothetical protein
VHKFIVSHIEDSYYIIMELRYVLDNEKHIRLWLQENIPNAVFRSIVIEFTTEEDVALFLLRWS